MAKCNVNTQERFADIQMLRYELKGFENLSLTQKIYIYCLSKATLLGRDITFDQQGKYNLRIRKTLEAVYRHYEGNRESEDFKAFEVYLKRVWFASGIHHHYGCEKFVPGFSEESFYEMVGAVADEYLPLSKGQSKEDLLGILVPVIFNPEVMPKRVNQTDGEDLVQTSACNFYENVSQAEVERFYARMKEESNEQAPSYGLNSKLTKRNGELVELKWTEDGLYGAAIKEIVSWLLRAQKYAENEEQKHLIDLLVKYYRTGDLKDFDRYSIAWVQQHEGMIDFINGFIEVYGDPLGLKGTWEGIVEYKDLEATKRTQTISQNAQWFEDHSPVNSRFRKPEVKGVTANVICAAMLGGEEYPASAIGINLPNANWIRQEYGSKSVTIGNLTEAYNKAAQGNGFRDEFVIDEDTISLMNQYEDITDDLHTDLHECLGHGSGQLLPGTDPDALKAYGSTIEEARADLFGLYYVADHKLVELGLTPNDEAYKAQYYGYLMNGLLTQTIRIKEGDKIEEAHMRNRALIAWWVMEHAEGAVELVKMDMNYASAEDALKDSEGNIITTKTYVKINDYAKLRHLFGELLAEIQRIKSEGDFEAARQLVEKYAVNIDPELHREILARYKKLNLAPYKGFINPKMTLEMDEEGEITDVVLDYEESYVDQMLRYSDEYGTL
ncbi:dipeptidyl peptidase 3 [Prevotella copri]|jgi:dipeptidyl-peptidase-3|uniref:Dipeptidyl peptidase 3 n=1 Tax=Segatella copri TaxID=165179 RepID=A0AAW5IPY2_9BACT|nr:dipeptidyl peptidase 3 [Segatella copri]MCP9552283.1 dipeptidyl peptidase 3 [Segatella copri]MCP9572417.1 dipeptidyl peptidase 3 [Segatella copri]MCP9576062.1 dipeptidyl peptidase 3 [Segatella copri]MCP9578919.1 dipeptidyl peptidase 3 [Segatella copri]MCP9581954.1 dipeptidyl peptidase 3 [Segatella copri]